MQGGAWLGNRTLLRDCAPFPGLLQFFKLEKKSHALNILNIVYDCVNDYDSIRQSGRKEANKKKIIANINDLYLKIVEVNRLIEDSDSIRDYEFERTYRAYKKHVLSSDEEVRPFWHIQNDLRFLASFLNLSLYRAVREPNYIRPPDNQAKTHIVDCAYGLTVSWGGPPFVTTPGSDFSAMCSLIFEIATSVADESLAGAINRYARSEERLEADKYEVEYGPDRERARDEDNFYDVKQASVVIKARIEELAATLRDPSLSTDSAVLVRCLLAEAVEEAERNEKAHGPFIMWASQMKIDWDAEQRENQARRANMLQLDIELGRLRRAQREGR